MPFPLLALAALPSIFKGIQGLTQLGKKVERTDTTPAAFTEALNLGRQQAASGRMPGMGMLQNRLAQVQANTVQNALRGSGSSADFLAAAGAAGAQRQAGEERLGAQGQQYQDQSRQRLTGLLSQQAAYQKADDDRYNMAKAALKQSGIENLYGAISDGATVGVTAMGGLGGVKSPALGSAAMLRPGGLTVGADEDYDYGQPYGGYRRRPGLSNPMRAAF